MHFPMGTALVLAIFGLVFFSMGARGLYRVWRFYKQMIPVLGVVSNCKRLVKGRAIEYRPFVQYQLNGKEYHVLCRTGKPSASKCGEAIDLRVDPLSPEVAESHGSWRLFWSVGYLLLGSALLIYSVFN